MDVKKIVQELGTYYQVTRQAGHTTLMKRGTSNFEHQKFVLCINREHAKSMEIPQNEIVTLGSLERLRGSNTPLAIDNAVLGQIFDETVLKLSELEKNAKRNRTLYLIASRELKKSKAKIKDMENHPFKTFFQSIFSYGNASKSTS